MVKSMASSGLTGPLLYQTAFNAFAALTGVNQSALLASAEVLATKLAEDRARVLQRHREKMGESPDTKAPPGPLALLQQRETQLQTDVAALTEQLAQKSQQLREIQQQAQAEKQKTQAALASYELANAAAAADLQAHRQAAQNFLTPTSSTPSSNA
jgi:DNA repair exonuclease SbcCD ATPase subunit